MDVQACSFRQPDHPLRGPCLASEAAWPGCHTGASGQTGRPGPEEEPACSGYEVGGSGGDPEMCSWGQSAAPAARRGDVRRLGSGKTGWSYWSLAGHAICARRAVARRRARRLIPAVREVRGRDLRAAMVRTGCTKRRLGLLHRRHGGAAGNKGLRLGVEGMTVVAPRNGVLALWVVRAKMRRQLTIGIWHGRPRRGCRGAPGRVRYTGTGGRAWESRRWHIGAVGPAATLAGERPAQVNHTWHPAARPSEASAAEAVRVRAAADAGQEGLGTDAC